MTEKRKMLLHLGKCIEDLDELHNVPDLKTKRATLLCKTAQKLFEKAEESREKGDEEYSYVYYMKYLRVIAFLSKDKEYLKDKAYFTSMLGVKNPTKAIDAAEKLKKSLIERYGEGKDKSDDKMAEECSKALLEQATVSEPDPTAGLPDLDEVTIRSEQLYPLLKSGRLRVMILDARPGRDFVESHINYPSCISVPEECIAPGQSAHVLEQSLPLTSRSVWAERASMDVIVMLDWSSTTVIPAKTLFLLKTILLKWDVKVHYPRPPLALWGGYEDWLLRYPAFTTNAQVEPPNRFLAMEDMLGDIEYPSWSDLAGAAAAAPPPPAALRAIKPGEPIVDRSSKAAAVQKYEERARNMALILEQQERIADTSLTLEMQRIEAEQDWKRTRIQREGEQRDELRSMYQLREQEISSQLMQLENKQYDMEQENQSLREQLEEYQRREREESERLAEILAAAAQHGSGEETRGRAVEEAEAAASRDKAAAAREHAAKRARIAAVTKQRNQLDRQREAMENERMRKLAEARHKKKPRIDKDPDGDTVMASPGAGAGSAGLTRSESTPSLKHQSDEDEAGAPAFDRSTKPSAAADNNDFPQRDFDPVWGNVGRGLTGLRNLGNTCYMNSIVQCLSNTTLLMSYFCSGHYLDQLNRRSRSTRYIADELAAVVRALWAGEYKHISANDLRREVGRKHRAFRGNEQQDSHEYLTILMDAMHHDLQFTITPTITDNMPASELAWHEYTRHRESLILRLFYGQIRSTVKCTVCGKQSVNYETFSNLSLELPTHSNRCTLSDCLNLYLTGETIRGWNCPVCQQKRAAVKKLDISRLPPMLVVHFKRFHASMEDPKNPFVKKQTYIDFPLTNLDMRPFALHCPHGNMYDLYAVSNHYGSGCIDSGHYTAACKSSVYGKWYRYDDHAVAELSLGDVKSSAAYILFYSTVRNV